MPCRGDRVLRSSWACGCPQRRHRGKRADAASKSAAVLPGPVQIVLSRFRSSFTQCLLSLLLSAPIIISFLFPHGRRYTLVLCCPPAPFCSLARTINLGRATISTTPTSPTFVFTVASWSVTPQTVLVLHEYAFGFLVTLRLSCLLDMLTTLAAVRNSAYASCP